MEHSDPKTPQPLRLRVLPAASRRPRCLVTDLHPERGLSRALCQHLSSTMRSLEFTLQEGGRVHSIWVCGFEPAQVGRVQELRERYPDVRLVVTSGRRAGDWQSAVLRAGADDAREWPLSPAELSQFLTGDEADRVSEAG